MSALQAWVLTLKVVGSAENDHLHKRSPQFAHRISSAKKGHECPTLFSLDPPRTNLVNIAPRGFADDVDTDED